jgi:hypothetical protein
MQFSQDDSLNLKLISFLLKKAAFECNVLVMVGQGGMRAEATSSTWCVALRWLVMLKSEYEERVQKYYSSTMLIVTRNKENVPLPTIN